MLLTWRVDPDRRETPALEEGKPCNSVPVRRDIGTGGKDNRVEEPDSAMARGVAAPSSAATFSEWRRTLTR